MHFVRSKHVRMLTFFCIYKCTSEILPHPLREETIWGTGHTILHANQWLTANCARSITNFPTNNKYKSENTSKERQTKSKKSCNK